MASRPCRQVGQQAAAGVVGVYRSAHFQQHGTGIQAFIHLHDGNTGFGIAGGNGPLDRAAPRQRGNREAWIFRQPWVYLSTALGRIKPYAATIITSGCSAASSCWASSSG